MNARERLVRHVHNLERLELAKVEAATALSDAFARAKTEGYDPATLRVVLKLRKMTPEQRKERRALEAIYMAALGMLEGDALPDEARRRLDPPRQQQPPAPPAPGFAAGKKGPGGKKGGEPGPTAEPTPTAAPPPQPPQQPLQLKDPEEARKEGRDAAAAGKRIYDNPYPAMDPCRAAWDEGWCAQSKSHGMDTPAAFQRRSDKPPKEGKEGKGKGAGDGEEKGAA